MNSSSALREDHAALGEPRQVDVHFHAANGRSGALAWGQQRVADLMADLRPDTTSLNLRLAWPIRAGATTEEVLDAIKEVMEACESIRTCYDPYAGADQQHVLAQGVIRVPVVASETASWSPAAAQEAAAELASAEFGPDDLPIRMRILVDRDDPVFLVFALCHLASDFLGIRRLLWHLRSVLNFSADPDADGLETLHPLDIRAWEESEAGQLQGARALQRHERSLLRMPQSMLPRLPIEPLYPRYQYVEIQTSAGSRCLSRLAERHGVSETAVGHAVLCLILAHASTLDRASLQVCVGNRFDRGFAAAVASLTQDVPTCITVDDSDFDTLLRRSAGAVRQATMMGRFPHKGLVDARERAEVERGFPLDLSFWLNSRIYTPAKPASPTGELIRDEAELDLDKTSVRWLGGEISSTSSMFAYLDRFDDVLALRTLVDTAYVTREEAEQWLRAFESILVTATLQHELGTLALARSTGIAPFKPTSEWAQIDHSWIHLPTATERLCAALPGVAVRLAAETLDGEPSLVGIVSDPTPGRDADIIEALRGCKVAMRPRRFVPEATA